MKNILTNPKIGKSMVGYLFQNHNLDLEKIAFHSKVILILHLLYNKSKKTM